MAKYSKKIVKDICTLIEKDSYTIAEICKIIRISPDTYHRWIKDKPDFSDSIKKAKGEYNEMIAVEAKKSLVKKIKGYDVEETKTVYSNHNNKPVIKEKTTIKKHINPDTAAIIFALTNRDPVEWKNHQNLHADVNVSPFNELMKKVAERKKDSEKNDKAKN